MATISFGEKPRQLRQKIGLTQWQIAERTGVSNTYISALERGRKPPPSRRHCPLHVPEDQREEAVGPRPALGEAADSHQRGANIAANAPDTRGSLTEVSVGAR